MSGVASLPFAKRSDGLIFRLTNRDIIERKAATMQAMAGIIAAEHAPAVVVDFRAIPGETSFLDRFELGETAARYLPPIALAVLMHERQMDPGRIGIKVAANRGRHIEMFNDPAAAEAWLERNARPPEAAP